MNNLKSINTGDLCLLCGAPAVTVGLFVPEDPGEWGAQPGRSRFFRYCLCSKCKGQPDTEDRVEKVIRAELDSGRIIYTGESYAQ